MYFEELRVWELGTVEVIEARPIVTGVSRNVVQRSGTTLHVEEYRVPMRLALSASVCSDQTLLRVQLLRCRFYSIQ